MDIKRRNVLSILVPGLLTAACGVGAGDLATSAFAGNSLGVAVLWAVLLGAFLKFVLTEGLTRWQLATGTTILEGGIRRIGTPFILFFAAYLFLWTYFVGAALISACGVTAHALIPVFDSPATGKVIWGVLHSLLGLAMVRLGGFNLFSKVMMACVGVMFVTVLFTAMSLPNDVPAILKGVFIPSIPDWNGKGLAWTVALMGGVGGTLTIIGYGYWIQEEGRSGEKDLRNCRLDIGVGYLVTALFGMAMVVIGHHADLSGKGAGMVVSLANTLEARLGATGRGLFLFGAWSAVFSSLLGVWQSVPYIFADFLHTVQERKKNTETRAKTAPELTRTRAYRAYLLILTFVPLLSLAASFKEIQKLYAIVGAAFIPLLAFVLLLLNTREKYVGAMKNRLLDNLLLLIALLAFLLAAGLSLAAKFG